MRKDNADCYPVRADTVSWKYSPEGLVLVSVPRRHIRGYVNEDALTVLRLCDGATAVKDMVALVAEQKEVSFDRAQEALSAALSYLKLIQLLDYRDIPGESHLLIDRNTIDRSHLNHLFIHAGGDCRYGCSGCMLVGGDGTEVADLVWQGVNAGVLGITLYGTHAGRCLDQALTGLLAEHGVTLSVYVPHGLCEQDYDTVVACPGTTVILPLTIPFADTPQLAILQTAAKRLSGTAVKLSVRVVAERFTLDDVMSLGLSCSQIGVSEIRLRPSVDFWPLSASGKLVDASLIGRVHNELFTRKLPVPDIVVSDICHMEPDCFICGAGASSLWIMADGSVRPCHYIDLGLGSIRGRTLSEVWGKVSSDIRFRALADTPVDCDGCEDAERCQGGCPAARIAAGNVHGVDRGRCLMYDPTGGERVGR